MNPRSRTNWTRDDEQRFQELAKQRDEILQKNRKPLLEIASDLFVAATNSSSQAIVEFLERNAERIRDALDPYDSGVRAPVVEKIPEPITGVAPARPTGPSRSAFYAALTKVKEKYDPDFCRLIMDTFGAHAKKMAEIDESRWPRIIFLCENILDYNAIYPTLHETNPELWLCDMTSLFNSHIQKLDGGVLITAIVCHTDGFIVSTDPDAPLMIKNFGDL